MAWNFSLRATKSVSELTSTSAPVVPFDREADEAFGGDAGRFLGGLGQALGAQPIDGRFHVAVGGGKRCLAVHHAYAGFLAQVLHHAAVISAMIVLSQKCKAA